ncbi:MAG TPA: terpene cyclase/mutase family protein [bacterium]|nr:terpene cyclase/mutase family protein [bacterium]
MALQSENFLHFLKQQQFVDGAFPACAGQGGDILITAEMVILFHRLKKAATNRDLIKKALTYLYQVQEEKGKWGNGYDVEEVRITAVVLRAFLMSGLDVISESVQKGLVWLVNRQKEKGAFPVNDNIYQPNVRATGEVLRLLGRLENSYMRQKDMAFEWLAGVQNEDGGFSAAEGSGSDPLVTADALFGLYGYSNYFKSNVGQRAIRYLIDTQHENGSWHTSVKDGTDIGCTAKALMLLQRDGVKGPVVQAGYTYLREKLELARWDQCAYGDLIAVISALSN